MSSWHFEFTLPKNPFRSKSPPPPPSVIVYVIPAHGDPYRTALPLIETEIRSALYPADQHHQDIFRTASASSTVYHYNESASQPNITLLPDTYHSGLWDQGAWEKRCVVGAGKMHLFYTLSENGMNRNLKVDDLVWGDVFILKVSDSMDKDGLNFYVDVEKDDVVRNVVDELLQKLAVQTQERIDDIGRRSDN